MVQCRPIGDLQAPWTTFVCTNQSVEADSSTVTVTVTPVGGAPVQVSQPETFL